jgi:hypothetical protein
MLPGPAATSWCGCCTPSRARGTTFDPASGHVRYLAPLEPAPDEPQLVKTSHNAFTTTGLQQLLTQRGITELVICGIRTEQCCETTARAASDLGYQVTFVTEATATNPIAHRDGSPARWSSTPAATGTSGRPAPCCGTAAISVTPPPRRRLT